MIALPVGIYSAMRQDTAVDYVGRSAAIIGLATPNFWLGIMVMIYPAIWWAWSPPMRLVPLSEDPLGNLAVFIIPSLVVGTTMSAATMRMTRTMMLEVLRQDYIRTAWSKGFRERVVVLRHAVKNALIPVVTLIGMQLPIRGFSELPRIRSATGSSKLGQSAQPGRASVHGAGATAGSLAPGLCLTITVYSLNMFGDAVRDLLDPRLRGGVGRLGAAGAKSGLKGLKGA